MGVLNEWMVISVVAVGVMVVVVGGAVEKIFSADADLQNLFFALHYPGKL